MASQTTYPASAGQCDVPQPDGKGDADTKLPTHVESVRDGLLDFNQFLGLQAAMHLAGENDEDAIPLSAYKTDGETESQRAREMDLVKCAQALAIGATSIEHAPAEPRENWQTLFRTAMNERMDSANTFGSNRCNSIAWVKDEDSGAKVNILNLRNPKPDLYFGFPVYDIDTPGAASFMNGPSYQNYTSQRLSYLSEHGLRHIPAFESFVTAPKTETGSSKREALHVCFPWAVVQVHGIMTKEFSSAAVSCASTVASTALSMLERLAKFADEKHDGQHIPPVISITSNGSKTTVWLIYCEIVDEKLRDHNMIPLWKGNIAKLWDAVQFCRIIDNMFFWAQHCIKPKVTKYLDQWRLRYCPEDPNIYSRLEKDSKTAEIVHRIQDRLSFLGITPNENLPALVRQAVILQEVMRSTAGKEISDLKAEDKNETIQTSIPNRPNETSREVAPSNQEQSEEYFERKAKHKSKEIQQQDCHSRSEKDDKRITQSSKLHDFTIFQPKSSPKLETTVAVVPDEDNTSSTKEDSTVGKYSRATSRKSPSSNLVQIKFLSSEERKSPLIGPSKGPDDANLNLVRRTLRSMAYRVVNGHVLPLEKQRDRKLNLTLQEKEKLDTNRVFVSDDSVSRKNSGKGSGSSDRPSPPQNPFVSETFELSFKVTRLVGLNLATWNTSKFPTRHRHGPYPILHIGMVEHNAFPRITGIHLDYREMILAREPTVIEPLPPPPPLKVRIPWRGKFIRVILPPTNPASVPAKSKSC